MTRVLVVGILAVLLAALPGAARAERKVVITGGGYGHGLGLSQWGAYERARNGATAGAIIRHYYTGVSVQAADDLPTKVRVGVAYSRASIGLEARSLRDDGGLIEFSAGSLRPIATGRADSDWRVAPAGRGIAIFKNGTRISADGKNIFAKRGVLRVDYEEHGTGVKVVEEANLYDRGHIEIESHSGPCAGGRCVRLILEIPLEKYLLGVAEVSPHWPMEALKTQTILSRTYVSYQVRRNGQHRSGCNCAVYDTSADQVYVGRDRRMEAGSYWDEWLRAVTSTEGVAALYRGSPILALYMASSGGHTEDNEEVWGGTPLPYLRGVPDAADATAANPHHKWRLTMPWSTFSARLNSYFSTGSVKRFEIKRPLGTSGRVTVVKGSDRGGVHIVGSTRSVRAGGYQVRTALGLKDTLFRVKVVH
ncbi:MAG: SpoIID/LytB domain-containing protein [Actinomycetota bacterium]|nr:SpoIID/LytB domain-containing protein [Actinomycetota bacterium]